MDIIELLKSVLLGIVEGITEWLPISSTGHMILVDEFVKMSVYADAARNTAFINMYLVVIQLGAILAVSVLFFHELNPFSPSKGKDGRRDTWKLWGKIVLGCIPAAAIGLPLNDWMEEHFYNAPVVAAALVAYGVAFIVIERRRAAKRVELMAAGAMPGSRPAGAHFASSAADADAADDTDFGKIASLEDLSWKTALGTSRSGSTIIGGLLLGCTREVASKFTFFLAIPVMFGASLLKVVKFFLKGGSFDMNGTVILLAGCAVAFVVSLLSIRWLMGFVKKHDFKAFGVYRIVLGILVLAYFLVAVPVLGL